MIMKRKRQRGEPPAPGEYVPPKPRPGNSPAVGERLLMDGINKVQRARAKAEAEFLVKARKALAQNARKDRVRLFR